MFSLCIGAILLPRGFSSTDDNLPTCACDILRTVGDSHPPGEISSWEQLRTLLRDIFPSLHSPALSAIFLLTGGVTRALCVGGYTRCSGLHNGPRGRSSSEHPSPSSLCGPTQSSLTLGTLMHYSPQPANSPLRWPIFLTSLQRNTRFLLAPTN
eukprot:Gb_38258 [translate_table: standard]